jgi:integrase
MLGERWTSGDLHRQFPHHIGEKRTAEDDAWRLEKSVYPYIGDKLISDVTLDDAERVMQKLPSEMASGTRRQIAQVIHRVMSLAVYPCRMIAASPIPRGWLPKPGPKKAVAILYPDEDANLLGCTAAPLGRRIAYGYLHREGHRKGEVVVMTWSDLDLVRGIIKLDRNKTDHPRMWKLSPGVAAALAGWKKLRGDMKETDRVFVERDGSRIDFEHLAAILRADLKTAGVIRAELFEKGPTRMRFGIHGLRHSFVTRSLATGKTEDWVRLRTGHKSNELWRYREVARSLEELELGDVLPLDQAIPELDDDSKEQG